MNITAYNRTRDSLGFFDATASFGRVLGKGSDVIDLLHRMSTNDLRPLMNKPGTGAQTVLTNEKGRIIDLLTVIARDTDALLITSKGREESVIQWLDKFVIMENAKFVPATQQIAQFGLFGPRAMEFLSQYTDQNLIDLQPLNAVTLTIGEYTVLLQKSLRVAESGWFLYPQQEIAEEVKRRIEADVLAFGGAVLDEVTYEALRIEAGIPTAPNELNEKHNPLETTLVSAVSFTKGCYIGQEVIARLDSYDKVQRHMLGIEIDGVPAEVASEFHDALSVRHAEAEATPETAARGKKPEEMAPIKIETMSGELIGELTSYTVSPAVGKVIGLGFIRTAHSNPNMSVAVRLHERGVLPAKIVKLPFDV